MRYKLSIILLSTVNIMNMLISAKVNIFTSKLFTICSWTKVLQTVHVVPGDIIFDFIYIDWFDEEKMFPQEKNKYFKL